jgi:hypothetical protein
MLAFGQGRPLPHNEGANTIDLMPFFMCIGGNLMYNRGLPAKP